MRIRMSCSLGPTTKEVHVHQSHCSHLHHSHSNCKHYHHHHHHHHHQKRRSNGISCPCKSKLCKRWCDKKKSKSRSKGAPPQGPVVPPNPDCVLIRPSPPHPPSNPIHPGLLSRRSSSNPSISPVPPSIISTRPRPQVPQPGYEEQDMLPDEQRRPSNHNSNKSGKANKGFKGRELSRIGEVIVHPVDSWTNDGVVTVQETGH